MTSRHAFRVHATGPTGRTGRVWMDDIELKGVTEVKLEMGVSSATYITITFIAESINHKSFPKAAS